MSVKCLSIVWEVKTRTPSMKLLLLALADNANDEGECWPSLGRLKTKVCVKSKTGIYKILNECVKDDLIKIESRNRKDGGQTTNLYILNLEKMLSENIGGSRTPQSTPPVLHRVPPPYSTEYPPRTPQSTPTPVETSEFQNKNNSLQEGCKKELSILTKRLTKRYCASGDAPQNAPSKFDEFWNKYPRKVNKKKAFSSWIKNKLDVKADSIIKDIVERTKNDIQWRDKKYIPHPSTYLNGERWDDEIQKFETVKNIVANDNRKLYHGVTEVKSTVREWAPGNPDYDRYHGVIR